MTIEDFNRKMKQDQSRSWDSLRKMKTTVKAKIDTQGAGWDTWH